jgi:hypothetical protein
MQATRPLGKAGQALWDQIWSSARWVDPETDFESVLMLCEAMDERLPLRVAVFQNNDWRQRAALRALDTQIAMLMDVLGLNPTGRRRLAVQVEESPFDELARRRASP